jgi:hypothetical protein
MPDIMVAAPSRRASPMNAAPTRTMSCAMVSKNQVDLLTPQFRDELTSIHERISGFATLTPDWDSYGTARPSARAIRIAQQVLDDLVVLYARQFGEKVLPFWASPLPNGGVSSNGDRRHHTKNVHSRSKSMPTGGLPSCFRKDMGRTPSTKKAKALRSKTSPHCLIRSSRHRPGSGGRP